MKRHFAIAVLVTLLGMATVVSAATLKGMVKNGTTGKPAAGDEVVLIALAEGMTEVARGSTDGVGRFSFAFAGSDAPHLVRVMHQAVAYHQLAPRGADSVDVQVYDAAQKLDGITATTDVQHLQAEGATLQVSEVITVRNASQPPRTLRNDRSFEISLPANAQLDAALAQYAGGPPLKNMPVAGERAGHYYFHFPLRPGETRFAVSYRLPYRDEAVIHPTILYPLERFVVMLPKSMKFEAEAAGVFQPIAGTKAEQTVFTANDVKAGQPVGFHVSGTGTLAQLRAQSETAGTAGPGGGLGPPSDLPDPLHNERWGILGGLMLMLALGGVYVARTPPTAARKPALTKSATQDWELRSQRRGSARTA